MKQAGLVVFFTFVVFYECNSQSVSELQKRKLNATKEIELTTQLLKETQKSQNASLEKVKLLNTQITKRNSLIVDIRDEIKMYQEFIDDNIFVTEMLTTDIEKIKNEYAAFIRSAYRNRNSGDKILLLLSAESFNQAYRRLQYLKRYSFHRNTQAEAINAIQEVLKSNSLKLEKQNTQHQRLVSETMKEAKILSGEKETQSKEIQKLQKKQKDLLRKLNEQKRIEQKLEAEIQRIIEEEARKSGSKAGKDYTMTPEQKMLGDKFEQNRNSLPWPVERGVITERFGINPHPVLTHVDVKNNGVNITTTSGAKVRAVFNGEVTRIFGITGGNTSVIIRHGNYLTVYSNLKEVSVKKGDKVTTRQNIGTVYTDTDDDNKSVLKFQIWRDNQKLNPEEWISR